MEQEFDWANLLVGVTCVVVTLGMIFAVGIAGLSFSCVGLVLVWFIRTVTPDLTEWSTLDMLLAHCKVDWITQRILLDYTTCEF